MKIVILDYGLEEIKQIRETPTNYVALFKEVLADTYFAKTKRYQKLRGINDMI